MTHRGRLGGLAASTVFAVAGMASVVHAPGQTEVKQGEVRQGSSEDRIFKSPVILEADLKAGLPENQGSWLSTNEFERYVCERVRLKKLETRVLSKKDHLRIGLRVRTYTEPGHDKKVRLEFEVLASGQTVSMGLLPSIDAEEKKEGSGYLELKVPTDKWPSDGRLRLRITMQAVDD